MREVTTNHDQSLTQTTHRKQVTGFTINSSYLASSRTFTTKPQKTTESTCEKKGPTYPCCPTNYSQEFPLSWITITNSVTQRGVPQFSQWSVARLVREQKKERERWRKLPPIGFTPWLPSLPDSESECDLQLPVNTATANLPQIQNCHM